MNPFEAPNSSGEWQSGPGIHFGRALWEATCVLVRLPQLLVLLAVVGLGYYAVCCSAGVLAAVVPPVVVWGLYARVLEAIDGSDRPGTLWAGARQPAGAAWAVVGLWAVQFGPLLLPLLGTSLAGLLFPVEAYLWLLLGSVFVSLFAARLLASPFLMVEYGIPFSTAMGLSWQLTADHPARWRAIALVTIAVSGPLQVLALSTSWELARYMAVHPQPELFGPDMLRYLWGPNAAVLLITSVAGVWGVGLAASAYRQLVPSSAELAAQATPNTEASAP